MYGRASSIAISAEDSLRKARSFVMDEEVFRFMVEGPALTPEDCDAITAEHGIDFWKTTDNRGSLPIHMLLKYAESVPRLDTIQRLVELYPECLACSDLLQFYTAEWALLNSHNLFNRSVAVFLWAQSSTILRNHRQDGNSLAVMLASNDVPDRVFTYRGDSEARVRYRGSRDVPFLLTQQLEKFHVVAQYHPTLIFDQDTESILTEPNALQVVLYNGIFNHALVEWMLDKCPSLCRQVEEQDGTALHSAMYATTRRPFLSEDPRFLNIVRRIIALCPAAITTINHKGDLPIHGYPSPAVYGRLFPSTNHDRHPRSFTPRSPALVTLLRNAPGGKASLGRFNKSGLTPVGKAIRNRVPMAWVKALLVSDESMEVDPSLLDLCCAVIDGPDGKLRLGVVHYFFFKILACMAVEMDPDNPDPTRNTRHDYDDSPDVIREYRHCGCPRNELRSYLQEFLELCPEAPSISTPKYPTILHFAVTLPFYRAADRLLSFARELLPQKVRMSAFLTANCKGEVPLLMASHHASVHVLYWILRQSPAVLESLRYPTVEGVVDRKRKAEHQSA